MMTRAGRMNVLLIAEACNPTWTSVPLVGYNFARALAARPDLRVTVATHVRNRAGLAGDVLCGLADVRYIDTEWLTAPLFRLARFLRGGTSLSWTTGTALAWPGYVAFEWALFRMLRRELERGEFDIVHRVTPLTLPMPSPLAGWTRSPMILGPLNGGLPWPEQYPELRAKEREWLAPLRGLYKMMPYYGSTWRRLAGAIAASRHTASEIPGWFRGLRFSMPENGVDPDRFPLADAWPEPEGRFRFVTAGRLVPLKAVDQIIDALSGPGPLRGCELEVIGDGPERPRLEEQVRRLGLTGRVTFAGWLTQTEVAARLRRAQAFVFPSLREFGGGAVLEAMAAGLPPVVVDKGGPAELAEGCGLVLPLLGREQLVPRLRDAMEALAGDTALARRLGGAASERVRLEFTWDKKARRLADFYREVLGGRRGGAACSTRCSAS